MCVSAKKGVAWLLNSRRRNLIAAGAGIGPEDRLKINLV